MLTRVLARCQARIGHPLPQHRSPAGQALHPVDDVDHQVEAIQVIEHHHVERRSRGASLLEPAHMDAGMVGTTVSKAVDQPWIAVVGENDRLVAGEQRIELAVRQAVGVLGLRLQTHDVDDVDHPDTQVGQFATQDIGGRQCL